jgi:hypothetical protein
MAARLTPRKARVRSNRPEAEALEPRTMLSVVSTYGQWTYSSRITYSFMPDGTSVAGTPSSLFQTMSTDNIPVATWQGQIEEAASIWEQNANVNLAQVSDGGEAFGVAGDQQDDPQFGDIRIGAIPLASDILAETFLPPPSNGGTAAGDIMFNSTLTWSVGGGIDLATVAVHEFGHALGLEDQSTDVDSVMYGDYNGINITPDSNDIAAIQSLYDAPKYDQFNDSGTHNSSALTATNITTYINTTTDQIAISGLDNTTAAQSEWYAVTVPATNDGLMAVTVQSSNLSSFAPTLNVYNSSLSLVASLSEPTTYGATLPVTLSVAAGQKYYIKVFSSGSYGRVGSYGLEVNFGTQSQSPIAPPNTQVVGGADGPVVVNTNAMTAGLPSSDVTLINTGGYTGLGYVDLASAGGVTPVAVTPPTATSATSTSPGIEGPIAALPGPSSTPTTTSPTVVALIGPLPAASPTTPAGPVRHKHVHQAVDSTLHAWTSPRKRPQIASKVRPAWHEHDSLS